MLAQRATPCYDGQGLDILNTLEGGTKMAQTKTAKEAQTEYVKHMGTPLGEQFSALWQELAWLYLKWGEYNELFGTKPSRVRLLNNAAPRFLLPQPDVSPNPDAPHLTLVRILSNPLTARRCRRHWRPSSMS